jgi:hypothetical protein
MAIKLWVQIVFYTIYKITNNLNDKIYIGKHQTKDLNDGYMGSGKHLRRAIEKYGARNFKKEILFQFDSEFDMNAKEAELVTDEFCLREDTYNLCPGGRGGWGYINSTPDVRNGFEHRPDDQKKMNARAIKKIAILRQDNDWCNAQSRIISAASKKYYETHIGHFTGKKHTEETKQKMKISSKENQNGSKNSQYGTMWITNGQENKKIKKEVDIIPEGWYKGRK